jgi:putative flippase GtrA
MSLSKNPLVRFLLVGGTNTVITTALVVALSYVITGWLAFTVAFTLGLIFSVLVTGKWVFDSHLTKFRTLAFGGSYLGVYAIGIGFVSLMSAVGAPPWINGASVLITAPLSFIAGKLVFGHTTVNPSALS